MLSKILIIQNNMLTITMLIETFRTHPLVDLTAFIEFTNIKIINRINGINPTIPSSLKNFKYIL